MARPTQCIGDGAYDFAWIPDQFPPRWIASEVAGRPGPVRSWATWMTRLSGALSIDVPTIAQTGGLLRHFCLTTLERHQVCVRSSSG